MNDNVQNMIGISAILALFLSACFLALGLTRQIDGALDEVSAVVSGQKRSVHSTLTLARPDIYSGSQAFLVTVDQVGAGVAVKVDGVPVASGDPLELAGTAVFQPEAKYRAEYVRDWNGLLKEIRFAKLKPGEDVL